jgi:hypothetical protein
MLKIDCSKWGENAETLREQALDEQIRDALKLSATPPQERTQITIYPDGH